MRMGGCASCTKATVEHTAPGSSTQTKSSTPAFPAFPTVRSVWMATSVPSAEKDIKSRVDSVCLCPAVWVSDMFAFMFASALCIFHEQVERSRITWLIRYNEPGKTRANCTVHIFIHCYCLCLVRNFQFIYFNIAAWTSGPGFTTGKHQATEIIYLQLHILLCICYIYRC